MPVLCYSKRNGRRQVGLGLSHLCQPRNQQNIQIAIRYNTVTKSRRKERAEFTCKKTQGREKTGNEDYTESRVGNFAKFRSRNFGKFVAGVVEKEDV